MLISIIVSNRKNGNIVAVYQTEQKSIFEAKQVLINTKKYPCLYWKNRTTAQNDRYSVGFTRSNKRLNDIEFIDAKYKDIMFNNVKEVTK